MIDVIYVEREALGYPLAAQVIRRHPKARVIEIERHGALFNRANQNFRLQKNRPALVLAVKHGRTVLPVPDGYGLGGSRNFYFSHMLNCLYDCRYCFLQGMYRSAAHVLYVNYEDFADAIRSETATDSGEPAWFFSGYDCDSLAMEPLTGFVRTFLPVFEPLSRARLELRTKSTQVRSLLAREPLANVVVAFSFTTAAAGVFEHRVPAEARRVEAMAALQARGWPVGLRFDPLIDHHGFEDEFAALLERIFSRVDPRALHSVCVGAFRLPRDFHRRMRRLYPREALFVRNLAENSGMVTMAREGELLAGARRQLRGRVPESALFFIEEGRA